MYNDDSLKNSQHNVNISLCYKFNIFLKQKMKLNNRKLV